MSIVNTSKPSAPSFSNTTRVSIGETWATETHTWANDPYTWAQKISNMSNITKQTSSITNTSKPA
jgi:hypothetical protein